MSTKQTIIPHLWFEKEAKEAAEWYASIFPNSEVTHVSTIKGTPSGDCDIVAFELWGQQFASISAGPLFKFNPSVSFIVNFDPSRESDAASMLQAMWDKMSDGGTALMPLGEYPFSKQFGWIQDKYGVSWQLMLTNPDGEERPPIVPALMFVGDNCGKAEEAMRFYESVFAKSRQGNLIKYPPGMEPDQAGNVMFADFRLEQLWLAAMDSAHDHKFKFNEAISFMVYCDTQAEIDHYWERLSAVPAAEQCGWLKDRYGLSWQIVPRSMDEMTQNGTPEQRARVTRAFMQMKKFDLAALQQAYEG
ncbi:VOC family protein [Paenibacillus rhizovicinus]|uniref:VOC family protein n=1 Tax=Paenibacillus rhizovicinus TaxID=2704463 RepID=A0A6C0P595_9BACL|nr:VOC family protein [Paenibacillus rhizovicinus]QHW33710.1 VOC family protein [Paenibacillus rhizovicinus]